jgi:hypothetical protein
VTGRGASRLKSRRRRGPTWPPTAYLVATYAASDGPTDDEVPLIQYDAEGVVRRPRALPSATMRPRISRRRRRRNTGRFHRVEVVADGHKEAKGFAEGYQEAIADGDADF